MFNYIMIAKNLVTFIPIFGKAITIPLPGKLKATSKNVRVNGKPVCLAKDFKDVKVNGVMYTSPPFVIPGVGEITIDQLALNQQTKKVKCNGKPILLKGMFFQAKFKVKAKALTIPTFPAPPVPDPMPQYMGQGMFNNTNVTVKAK